MPELGLLAVTRGMLGAGVALLVADKLPRETRTAVGWTLFLVGAISTVPLARDVLGKLNQMEDEQVLPAYRPPLDLIAEER
jgi:uncharacterized membrane protein